MGVLRQCSAYDLSNYSDRSLRRRLQKLLDDEGITFNTLMWRLRHEPEYSEQVMNHITVNTSELFRDPVVWQFLRSRVLPQYRHQKRLNVWHAGCSRGQEVYSMMILLHQLGLLNKSMVYASDINAEMLHQARAGVYPFSFNLEYLNNFDQVINVNPLNYEERLNVPYSDYFHIDREHDTLTMHSFLRDKPVYRKNDLVRCENPFFVKFDMIFCRNVIIYFNSDLQNRLFDFFYRYLYPWGVLVLGIHESIVGPWLDSFQRFSHVYVKQGEE